MMMRAAPPGSLPKDLVALQRFAILMDEQFVIPGIGTRIGLDALIGFVPGVVEALDGIAPGDRIIVLTWLDRARRDVLRVHPRDDTANPIRGVIFSPQPKWMPGFSARYEGTSSLSARIPRLNVSRSPSVHASWANSDVVAIRASPEIGVDRRTTCAGARLLTRNW